MKGIALAATLAASVVLAACGQREEGYPPHIEYNFMQACEARQPAAGVCACIWGRISAEVPRAEFEALERLPAAEREAHPLTAQITGYAMSCAPQPEAQPEAEPEAEPAR